MCLPSCPPVRQSVSLSALIPPSTFHLCLPVALRTLIECVNQSSLTTGEQGEDTQQPCTGSHIVEGRRPKEIQMRLGTFPCG